MRALLDYDSFLVIYQGFLLTGLALANLKLDSFKKMADREGDAP